MACFRLQEAITSRETDRALKLFFLMVFFGSETSLADIDPDVSVKLPLDFPSLLLSRLTSIGQLK